MWPFTRSQPVEDRHWQRLQELGVDFAAVRAEVRSLSGEWADTLTRVNKAIQRLERAQERADSRQERSVHSNSNPRIAQDHDGGGGGAIRGGLVPPEVACAQRRGTVSYFGGTSQYRGDPGFFGTLGKLVKSALPVAASVIPGVGGVVGRVLTTTGRVAGRAAPAIAVGATVSRGVDAVFPSAPPGMAPVPGFRGTVQRFLPGGETGYYRRRRRTNFANQKALNRAIARVSGFGRLVKRSKRAVQKANTALNPRRGPVKKTGGRR